MGLDDFGSGDTSHVASGGSNTPNTSTSSRWNQKVDFGKPYVILARDRQGNLYKHKDYLVALKDADDWERLEDHPNKDFEVLFSRGTKEGWLRFCNLVQDQFGEDPEEVLEEDPKRLMELDDKVHYPPGRSPSKARTCAVCEARSDDEDVAMMELHMDKHRRLSVCASHTVEELASEGLLQ